MAVDQESGDATFTTVVVDVLSEGQSSKEDFTFTTNYLVTSRPKQIFLHVFLHCSPS